MPFLLTTCAVGAEAVLRRLMFEESGLRAAFARPGVISFKCDGPIDPDGPRPHPLVRTWGVSLGFAKHIDEMERALVDLPCPIVQVVVGEAGPKGHVPPTILELWDNHATQAREALATRFKDRLRFDEPQKGDPVLEVLVRPNEPWILSWHLHGQGRGPLVGAAWELNFPADAPSRSWAKVEDLIRWSGVSLRKGQTVLEIGSSPGGASMALLDRGLSVCSVDPRPVVLPERLQDSPFVQHFSLIERLPRENYPEKVDWIVVDMGVSAPVAVHALCKIVPRYRHQLHGMLITLKLNEWDLAERLPALLAQLRGLGFSRVEAANLPTFRQEIGVVALP